MANGKKILIAEDIQEDRDLIEAQLSGAGYSTVLVANGIEALEKINVDIPDLVITDVLMSGMDGFAFFKELKKNDKTKDIPVVILSVRARMKDTFLALGANEFIVKPFKVEDMLSKVNMIMGIDSRPVDSAPQAEAKAEAQVEEKTEERVTEEETKTKTDSAEPVSAVPSSEPQIILKKVFIAGSSQKVLEKIGIILEKEKCQVLAVSKGSEILGKSMEFNPDIIILDVLISGALSHEIIRRIRRQSGFKDKPIIVFSFLDRENAKVSVHQQALNIESGRRLCVEAGAKESLGGFDESTFIANIKKYLEE